MSKSDLDGLRHRISEVDRQILELVAERSRISRAIGRVKRDMARPTRDFARERVVVDEARAVARELGLSEDLAATMILALIRSSLEVQELDRVVDAASGDGQRALVIGGAGKMGSWFARFLSIQGFRVEIADPGEAPSSFPRVADWRELTLDHDLIVLATPIPLTAAILAELAKAPPSGVVFDVGSLKTPLRSGLLALAGAGAKVTSIHPMFGPDTRLLSRSNVLFVDLGCPAATRAARALFAPTMATLLDVDLDVHDRVIAFVLGLSHALNIAFNEALASCTVPTNDLSAFSSTTFQAQLDVSRRVSLENPRLYYEIQALNDYGQESLDALHAAVSRLRDTVASQDEAAFVAMMEDGRHRLDHIPR